MEVAQEETKTTQNAKSPGNEPAKNMTDSLVSSLKDQLKTQTSIKKTISILEEELELLSLLPKKTIELTKLMPSSDNDEISQFGKDVIVLIAKTLADFVDSCGDVALISAFCQNFNITIKGQIEILKKLPAVDTDIENFIDQVLRRTLDGTANELDEIPKKFHQIKEVTKDSLKNLTEKLQFLLNCGGVIGTFDRIQQLMKEIEILHGNHRNLLLQKNWDLLGAYQKRGILKANETNNEFWQDIAENMSNSLKQALKENETKLKTVRDLQGTQQFELELQKFKKDFENSQSKLNAEITKQKSDLDKKYGHIENKLKDLLWKKISDLEKVEAPKVEASQSYLWFWSSSFSTVSTSNQKENLEKEISELNDEIARNAENWETAKKQVDECYDAQLKILKNQEETLKAGVGHQNDNAEEATFLEKIQNHLQEENNILSNRLLMMEAQVVSGKSIKVLLENEKKVLEKQIDEFEDLYREKLRESTQLRKKTFEDLNKAKSELDKQVDNKKMGSVKQIINFSIAANGFIFAMTKHGSNLAEINSLVLSMHSFLRIQIQQIVNVATFPITGLNFDEYSAERVAEFCKKGYSSYPQLAANVLKFGLFGTVIINWIQTENKDDLDSPYWDQLGLPDKLARLSFYTFFNGLMQGESGKKKKEFALSGLEAIMKIISFKNNKKEVIDKCGEEVKKLLIE